MVAEFLAQRIVATTVLFGLVIVAVLVGYLSDSLKQKKRPTGFFPGPFGGAVPVRTDSPRPTRNPTVARADSKLFDFFFGPLPPKSQRRLERFVKFLTRGSVVLATAAGFLWLAGSEFAAIAACGAFVFLTYGWRLRDWI